MTLTLWPRAFSVWLLGLMCIAACSNGGGEDSRSCRLTPDWERGAPERYRVTLTRGGESISQVCPDGIQEAGDPIVCTEGEVAFDGDGVQSVHLRAHGYTSRTLFSDDLCGRGAVAVAMSGLSAYEANDDYRTGFATSDPIETFTEMAVLIPSDLGAAYTVKFYMEDINSAPLVFFQNTTRNPLHYPFVRNVLERPLSQEQYEAATYAGDDRTAMAGSVIYYPDLTLSSASLGGEMAAPFTIEFFPSDNLTVELALIAHRLIEECLGLASLGGPDRRLCYLPAASVQETELAQHTGLFDSQGAAWLYRTELYGAITRQLLNPGVAYGTLRLMTPEQLATEVVSYQDILLLTRLPSDLPLVGGTITEELQTPLAHVNVAARARGTPNMALIRASLDARIEPHIGGLVRFEVTPVGFTLAPATLEEARDFWDALIPDEELIPVADLVADGLPGFADLGFEDAITVGVKAANLAELHNLLGDTAPDGFAVPFSYFEQFMHAGGPTSALCWSARDNCIQEGRGYDLCDQVRVFCNDQADTGADFYDYLDALMNAEEFTTQSPFREGALDGLRYLMHHTPAEADFAAALDARVGEMFGGQPVRLRSSTNAEDLETFSGAGLYRSVSVALGSEDAPSSRIRKVWASVFNWQAWEERSFWNMRHTAVKMGVAVHRAFPDEAANGVLITRNLADPGVLGFYVNVQLGEVSVTNPEGGDLPEIFTILWGSGSGRVVRLRYSSLSPDASIMSDGEITALYDAAFETLRHFAGLYHQSVYDLALDLEFKLEGPDRALVIKQVRPYFERSR